MQARKNKKNKEESFSDQVIRVKIWLVYKVGGTFFNINSTHKLFVISFMFTKKNIKIKLPVEICAFSMKRKLKKIVYGVLLSDGTVCRR